MQIVYLVGVLIVFLIVFLNKEYFARGHERLQESSFWNWALVCIIFAAFFPVFIVASIVETVADLFSKK